MIQLFILLFTFMIIHNEQMQGNNIDCFDMLNSDYDINKMTILKHKDNRKCHFTFLMNASNDLFIIKQITKLNPTKQLKAVRESLGAYIAESNNLRANQVRIVPAGFAIPGKDIQRPATLHTVVPGDSASKLSNAFKLDIKQPIKENPKQIYHIIHSMSLHSDLPAIVAFDTFIGNRDRKRSNFFYDKTSDTFWMIDMEQSFKNNLCKLACTAIHMFLNNQSFNFTATHINGLIIYRDTLKNLIKNHPPHTLHKKLDEFLFQAGIKPGYSLFNNEVIAEIQQYKDTISKSYTSAQQLVTLLDKLINRYKINKRVYNYNYEQFNIVSTQEESCTCPIDQHIIHNIDWLCSKEQRNYIVDRLRAYENAF